MDVVPARMKHLFSKQCALEHSVQLLQNTYPVTCLRSNMSSAVLCKMVKKRNNIMKDKIIQIIL